MRLKCLPWEFLKAVLYVLAWYLWCIFEFPVLLPFQVNVRISLTSLQLQAALCIPNCNSLTDDMPILSLKTRLTIVLKIEKKTNARISLHVPKLFMQQSRRAESSSTKWICHLPKNKLKSVQHPPTYSVFHVECVFSVLKCGALAYCPAI